MTEVATEKNVRQASLNYYATEQEKQRAKAHGHIKPDYLRPDSVCVVAIGNKWEPEAWQRITDMVEHTNRNGVCCWFHEIMDAESRPPYTMLEAMRDAACLYAHNLGFEWVLVVENDVLPEPDMLINLLKWQMPIVVPYLWEENFNTTIAEPRYKQNTGLHPVEWSALSCILIWGKVLNCFANASPFQGTYTERMFADRFLHYGHRIFQDTNTELKLATMPTYGGHAKDVDSMLDFWRKTEQKRRSKPNRKAIDPDDKNQYGGVYLPPTSLERNRVEWLSLQKEEAQEK